jgi:hypothetical protein
MPGLVADSEADQAAPDQAGISASTADPYRSTRYILGRGSDFYGIWDASTPNGEVIERFPATAAGWFAARRRLDALDHLARATTTSPIIAPLTDRTTFLVAGVVLAGVVLGIAGLFPNYLGGSNLVSQGAELLPHVAYVTGWALVAGLLLAERRFARGASGLGLGLSLISFGFFLTDVLTAIAGQGESPGAGLYLSLVGWLACSAGSAAALIALRSRAPRGRPSAWRHPVVALGAIGALGAAVAFALPWDRYTLTAATTHATQTTNAGDIFANPGAIIAGNVVTMILIIGVLAVAIAWRPTVIGITVLAGALVPLAAQVFATLAQPVPALSEFGITAAQAAEGQVSIAASYTGWFYLYCAFVAGLVVLAGWIASNTSSEATT